MRDAIRGGERVALDAVRASSAGHAFLSVSKQGVAGIVETTGNRDCHVVLPPTDVGSAVSAECAALAALDLPTRVMINCGTPASDDSQATQARAVQDVADQVRGRTHTRARARTRTRAHTCTHTQ